MTPEFWIGLAIGVGVFMLNAIVRRDAPQRHARFQMRAKLARLLYDGKLSTARVRKGKLLVPHVSMRGPRRSRAPKRDQVLSLVRRDDQSA